MTGVGEGTLGGEDGVGAVGVSEREDGDGAETDDSVMDIDGVRLIIELGERSEIGGED